TSRKEPTMFWQRLWQRWMDRSPTSSRTRLAPRRRARLLVEPLEDRAVPANFTVATVPDLIGAVTAANLSAAADTITLAPRTAVNNPDDTGATGLPVIAASGGSLTIVGNGDVIERTRNNGTPAFRLLKVDFGASLTLQDLTLQGGRTTIWGGAIYNVGSLTL